MKKHPPIIPYFPQMIHGADYNPDQWLREGATIWNEDMRLAKLAHMNSLSVGIFAWAALEPEEGRYTFDWLDRIMDMLAENGMKAVLATPSGARPAWLSQKYPQVLRVRSDRGRNQHGQRHNHCLTSPVYREKVLNINGKLALRYKDHPALGLWHISNEYGGDCHCELCQEKFREYLKQKYKTLDALNHAWWTAFWSHLYTDWSQIESPGPHAEKSTHGLNIDWKRFTTEQYVDFFRHEIKPMREHTPQIPCTVNLMGTYTGIDYFRLAQEADVVSWDAYPQWTGDERDIAVGQHFSFLHDLTRGLKGKPFLLMESSPSATNWQPVAKLRRPGVHMLQSLQAVAHGSDSVQYFQFRKGRGAFEKFHGAVVDHAGHEHTRVFEDVAGVGKLLEKLSPVVGTDTPARVALVYDWNNRWAIDDMSGLLQDKTGYEQTVRAHYNALWNAGIPVDIIDETGDFSGHDVLIAPMLYMLRGDIADRIRDFVAKGGTYIATYVTGYVNEADLCYLGGFPGDGLSEVLGIWAEEIDALYPQDENAVLWQGKSYRAFDLCELIHARGAQVLATYGQDFYKDRPALTLNEYGKGKAYFIAARTGEDFLADFYAQVLSDAGIAPVLEEKLPAGVTAQVRCDGESEYVFLMNFTPAAQTVAVGEGGQSLIDGAILRGDTELAPHGVQIYKKAK